MQNHDNKSLNSNEKDRGHPREGKLPSKKELSSTPKVFKISNVTYRSLATLAPPKLEPREPNHCRAPRTFSARDMAPSLSIRRRRKHSNNSKMEKPPALVLNPDRANSPTTASSFVCTRPFPYIKHQLEAALRTMEAEFNYEINSHVSGYTCTGFWQPTGSKLNFKIELYSINSSRYYVSFRKLAGKHTDSRKFFAKIASLSGLNPQNTSNEADQYLDEKVSFAPSSLQNIDALLDSLSSSFAEEQLNAIESLSQISLCKTFPSAHLTSTSTSGRVHSSHTSFMGKIMARVSPLIASVEIDSDVHREAVNTIANIADRLVLEQPGAFMELIPRVVAVASRSICRQTQKYAVNLMCSLSKAADLNLKQAMMKEVDQIKQCCERSYLEPRAREIIRNLGCAF